MPEQVYFYCCPAGSPNKQPYQHALICLAEGLRELNIPFYADRNYWRLSPESEEYLFNNNPDIGPDDCSIVVIDSEWVTFGNSLPSGLFHKSRKYATAYLEIGDLVQSNQSRFHSFDFIFRASCSNKIHYPSNVHPYAYGLSNRIIEEVNNAKSSSGRENSLLINFRHTQHGHSVRKYVDTHFTSKIQRVLTLNAATDDTNNIPENQYHAMQWCQTGRRHYPQYYARLAAAKAVASFGGYFTFPWPTNQQSLPSRIARKLLSNSGRKSNLILQWDSWRFWESLASGCATFHIDFEKYGCRLPVMPENGRHYIGVDLDNIEQTLTMIEDQPSWLETVGAEGQKWVLNHYAPKQTAARFLEKVKAA